MEEERWDSVDDLAARLGRDVGDLVNAHMQIARVELMADLRHAGRGAHLTARADLAGHRGAGLASVAIAVALGQMYPLWTGFLAVAIVWAIYGAAAAVLGRRALRRVTTPSGEVLEAFERDSEWLRRRSD